MNSSQNEALIEIFYLKLESQRKKKSLKIQQLTISFSCLKTPEITMCSTACQYEVWVHVLILASKYICIRYMYLFLILTCRYICTALETHSPSLLIIHLIQYQVKLWF